MRNRARLVLGGICVVLTVSGCSTPERGGDRSAGPGPSTGPNTGPSTGPSRDAVALGAPPVTEVAADAETQPTQHAGDSADDPAIWVDPEHPEQSLVIGNDKQGALETYDLDGTRQQRLTSPTSFWGNVDVRQGVTLADRPVDVVAAANDGLRLFEVDGATRTLTPLLHGDAALPTGGGEGLCLYDAGTEGLFVFMVLRTGEVHQFSVTVSPDGTGSLGLVRTFAVGSESEGCVVDDSRGTLYVAQEDVGLWRYGAAASTGSARELVDAVVPDGGHQTGDIEGVTLLDTGAGQGFVVTSSQAPMGVSSYFSLFDRVSGAYRGSFRIADGTGADGCSHTDGITATTSGLGPAFPQGVFVCQDDHNTGPGSAGNQDFKLTRLEKVLATAR